MVSKNDVKYIQSLYHKKARDKENVFIVEGTKLVQEALQSNFEIKNIYAVKEWKQLNDKVDASEVTEDELKKLSRLETPNRVLAVVKKKEIPETSIENNTLTLLLDGIQDPGNMGTIIRIADWFGIEQIVATKDSADCFNPKTVQSTMGSIFRIPVFYTDAESFLQKTKAKVYAAMLNGEKIQDVKADDNGILIIGNESKGIRENLLPFIDERITIPSFGRAESLNAAVATGIILSHIIR